MDLRVQQNRAQHAPTRAHAVHAHAHVHTCTHNRARARTRNAQVGGSVPVACVTGQNAAGAGVLTRPAAFTITWALAGQSGQLGPFLKGSKQDPPANVTLNFVPQLPDVSRGEWGAGGEGLERRAGREWKSSRRRPPGGPRRCGCGRRSNGVLLPAAPFPKQLRCAPAGPLILTLTPQT